MTRPGSLPTIDQTSRILIVGASRGVGLGLARVYAASGWTVHATTRTPAEPGELGRIEGDIRLHQLDVRDEAHIEQMVADLDGVSFDVLIHNAGIYRGHSPDEMMAVNVAAPIRSPRACSTTWWRAGSARSC